MDPLRVFRQRAGSEWSVRENARAASRFLEDHKGLAAAGALTLLGVGAEVWRRSQKNQMYTELEEEGPPAPRARRVPRALKYTNELTVILKECRDVPISGESADTVIVDPAGMHFIEKNTTQDAKGASRAIYDFLGIKTFPEDVTDKIKKEGDARRAKYTVPGKSAQRGVVHVVGPDFTKGTTRDVLWHDAVARLGTAYANAINEAEYVQYVEYVTGTLQGTAHYITAVRLPVISGGIFAGKFGYDAQNGGCVPELTARAISYALKSDTLKWEKLTHKYWLCMWKDDDIDRFHRALKLASSVEMYKAKDLDPGHPHKFPTAAVRLPVKEEIHVRGAVGYARDLYKRLSGENETEDTKIGLMIAGNNGRPGGSVGKGLESIPIVNNNIVNDGVSGILNTQEESVVSAWLDAVAGSEHEERSRVFRSTICGMWGQVEAGSDMTIQGVNYMKSEDAKDYKRAWVVRDAHLEYEGECTATLVFVAGPNANENAGRTAGGSTKMTFSQKANESYDFFIECVKQSVLAGLIAMREENVTHALVACVSCGLYAGKHEGTIKQRFKDLVDKLVYDMQHNFTEVTIVGIPEDSGLEQKYQLLQPRAAMRRTRTSKV
jgi:hypothetical protein